MKKAILRTVLSVLAMIICVCTWALMRHHQVIEMNGTKLTLLGVTYGKHHVPPKGKSTGNRRGGSSIDTTNDTIVAWILSEHKSNQRANYQLLVSDMANTACVGSWSRNSSQIKSGMDVMGFLIDTYPRWDKKITLRPMSWDNGQRVAKDHFTISNPARKSAAR